MALNYKTNPEKIKEMLTQANNPQISPVRAEFLGSEYGFFRRNIRDSAVFVAGSGLGHDTFELASYNLLVTGVEILPLLFNDAQEEKKKRNSRNVVFYNGDILKKRFMSSNFDNNQFDFAVMNMATIGNFKKIEEVIESIKRIARVFYFDFYKAGDENLEKRKLMYEQEGWQDVTIKENRVVSSDGLDSRCITRKEILDVVSSLDMRVIFSDIYDFATMAMVTQRQNAD